MAERMYIRLSEINENRCIVRESTSGRVFVQKDLMHYNAHAFYLLQQNPHPYIAQIYDFWETPDGILHVIEGYVNGQTLTEYLWQNGPCSVEKTVDIGLQLCDALIHLHGLHPPIIYRDIKPNNIIIDEQGKIKLIDFETARIYQPGELEDTTILGTAGFAAPEQFGFLQTDARTDIYAMGVVLNYLCTSALPKEMLHTGTLQKIIETCLQLDPAERYATAYKLKTALQRTQKRQRRTRSTTALQHPFYKNIPGFRTGSKLKAVIAIFGYLAIIILPFTTSNTLNGAYA